MNKHPDIKLKADRILGLLAGGLLLTDVASANVTTMAYYRLGENDPGAVAGQAANLVTTDLGGGAVSLYLSGTNSPVYSSSTGVNGSTLCIAVAGGGYTNHASFGLTDNWGVEAWVNAAEAIPSLSGDGYASIVYNGDSAANGMGIYQTPGGQFVGLCGNVAVVVGEAVAPGTWTHLAVVTTGGTTTFYVNGTATGTGGAPITPTSFFSIGLNPSGVGGGELFQGSVDELRVFTFASGEFSTDDLLLTQVPPTTPQAPTINNGPVATPANTLMAGDTLSLSVVAAGSGPLFYYWRQGAKTVAAGTDATVSFANGTTNLSGDYSVVVSNSVAAITSAVVQVTIVPAGSSSLVAAAYYRLGENDPGAVAGQPADGTTVDVINGTNLAVSGTTPTYSSNTGVRGSTLCIATAGGGYTNDAPFALDDNWGIEVWVKADVAAPTLSTDGYATIAFNGDSGHNGMGIVQTPDGRFVGLCALVALVGGAPVAPGVWTHLALVTAGGTTTFYVNGVPTGTAGRPFAPASFFGIGLNPGGYGGGEPFEGRIDEVRVFRFVPGLFSTNDLLLASAPPAPSASILHSGANVVVTWSGERLQQSASLAGPWTTITNATSPAITPTGGASRFFRPVAAKP